MIKTILLLTYIAFPGAESEEFVYVTDSIQQCKSAGRMAKEDILKMSKGDVEITCVEVNILRADEVETTFVVGNKIIVAKIGKQ